MIRALSQRLQEVEASLGLLRGLTEVLRKRSAELGFTQEMRERLTSQVERLMISTQRAEAQCEFLQVCSEREWGEAANDLDALLTKLEHAVAQTQEAVRRPRPEPLAQS